MWSLRKQEMTKQHKSRNPHVCQLKDLWTGQPISQNCPLCGRTREEDEEIPKEKNENQN